MQNAPDSPRTRRRLEEEVRNPLEMINDNLASQRDFLFDLRTEWYRNALFVRGHQDINVSRNTGHAVAVGSFANRGKVYNMTLPIVEQLKGMYQRSNPSRKAVPTTDDLLDEEAAELGTDLIRWAQAYHKIHKMVRSLSDKLVVMGNCDLFVGWNPTGGDVIQSEDGQTEWVGVPILEVVSPFQSIWDTRGADYTEATWYIREYFQTEEWLYNNYPEKYGEVPREQGSFVGNDYLERSLMTMGSIHAGASGRQINYAKGHGLIRVFECYEIPCRKYPTGRIIVAAGSADSASVLLHSGPNPYGSIPSVHFNMLDVTNRFHGESYVNHLIDPQMEYNRRNRQISKNADKIANGKLYVPHGVDKEGITDEVGGMIEGTPQSAPPAWIVPPGLPEHVYSSREEAKHLMDLIAAPAGPGRIDRAASTTSGIQLSLLEEREKEQAEPLLKSYQECWDAAWQKYLDNFRIFGVHSRNIAVPQLGDENKFRTRVANGAMLTENVRVTYREGDETPKSRVATFAEIIELQKAQFFAEGVMDPKTKQLALDAIGHGNLAPVYRDKTADIDKAKRNVIRARFFDDPMDPLPAPEPEDNVDVHVAYYMDFRKSSQYEEMGRDNPIAQYRFDQMLKTFMLDKQIRDEARLQAMIRQQSMMAGAEAQAKEAAKPQGVSAPQGPKATQGQSRAPAPHKDQGGRQAS